MIGKITFYSTKRAFAFIREPNKKEWFMHKSDWTEFVNPRADDIVIFDLRPSFVAGRPEQAANVRFATAEEKAALYAALGGAK